jgi:hypothetical protein
MEMFTIGGGAILSPCERYRYVLTRGAGAEQAQRWACFVMLNPSTADAIQDDPTIRRCLGFSRREHCDALIVVNLFAWRATDPMDLVAYDVRDPVGTENGDYIRGAALLAHRTGGPVVCAWGAHGRYRNQDLAVLGWIEQLSVPTVCLGTTAFGDPRHPLYVSRDAPLQPFVGRKASGRQQ